MSFLYPSFLWALFALSIPILIHLLNLQRTIKLDFPSIQFLQEAKKETSSQQKLKHWLILLSRCLFIACLVLAFAQPFFSKGSKDIRNNVGIYIDNSLSMENQPYSEITALEEAKQLAIAWVEDQATTQGINLVTNDYIQSYQSKKKLIEKISKIELSTQSLKLEEIKKKLSLDQAKQKVILLSDFQKTDFNHVNDFLQDSINLIEMVTLNQGEEENIFIDSVWEERAFQKSKLTKLGVKLGAYGKKEKEKVSLKLFLDKRLVGTALVDIDSKQGGIAYFDISTVSEASSAYLEIEDFPISFDNTFYLKLHSESKQHIIIIDQDKSSPLYTIYDDTTLFKLYHLSNPPIPKNLKEKNALVVFRGDVSKLPSLKEHIRSGNSLIFIPTNEKQLAQGLQENFGIQMKTVVSKEMQALELSDQNNPLFSYIFERKQEKVSMPSAKQCIQARVNTAFIEYADGSPFLFSKAFGDGEVFLFTSPIDKGYTNFHHHALCIPFFYQIALSSSTFDEPIYFRAAQKNISFSLQDYVPTEAVHLTGDGYDVIPSQAIRNKKVTLDLPKDIWMGDYALTIGGKTFQEVAVNSSKKESKTSYYSQSDLEKLFSDHDNVSVFGQSSMRTELLDRKLSGSSIPLWKYCVALSLLFLIVEIFLIRFLA